MKILTTPNPFLRKKARGLKTITKETRREVAEMIKTLKKQTNPEGVGLAAVQVGIDKQIFILLLDKPYVFVNPKVIKKSKEYFSTVHKKASQRWLEGCLSIPKIWGFVDRPLTVTLKYLTFDPLDQESKLTAITKEFTDIESAYVQHETDHLNGILFTDHILEQGGEILEETKTGLVKIN